MQLTEIERLKLAVPDARPTTVDRAARRFVARALSGAPIRRIDPVTGRAFDLVFDMTGADLSRFNGGTAPLLDSHQDAGIDAQLGIVRRAWIEGGALLAEIELSTRPTAEALFDDLERGVVRAVSIGVELLEVRDETDREGRLARRVVTKWTPYELSLVPIPADPQAMILSMHGGRQMTQQNEVQTFDARAAAAKLAAQHGLDQHFIEAAANAKTAEEVRNLAFDELARRYETAPTRSRVAFVTDETETRREALSAALLHRVRGGEPAEIAKPYLYLRLPDAARECLRWRGVHLAGMSDARVVQLAMTTSDFPQILGNVANKSLLEAYRTQPAVLRQICRITTASDFKERRALRLGGGTGLQLKAEGADYTYGAAAEQTSSYQVRTYGKIFAFTREMLINDDLGAFDQWMRAAGRLAVDFEARLIVDLLTANNGLGPVLSDGKTLFHADHGNLAASGGTISVQTLDAARGAMRRQKGIDGVVVIDADPRYLVVPAAKQTTAEQVTTAITPAQTSNVNPFAGRLAVLAEPRLDDASTTAWYLAADPANVPTFEFSYLEGSNGPQTETETDFDRDVLKFKLRLDIGIGCIDWRGIYRNPGA